MKKWILTITLLLISSVIFGQGYSYSYVDPCTKKLNTVYIPAGQSSVTVSYLGQSRSFTKTELEDGSFNAWINVLQSTASEPCGEYKGKTQTTQNTLITSNIISTLTSVTSVSTLTISSTIGNISSQSAGNSLSNSVSNSSDNSSGENKTSKEDKNGGNTNNPTTTTNNSSNTTGGENGTSQGTNPPSQGGTSQEGGSNSSSNQSSQTGNQSSQPPVNNQSGSNPPSSGGNTQSGSNPPSQGSGQSGSNETTNPPSNPPSQGTSQPNSNPPQTGGSNTQSGTNSPQTGGGNTQSGTNTAQPNQNSSSNSNTNEPNTNNGGATTGGDNNQTGSNTNNGNTNTNNSSGGNTGSNGGNSGGNGGNTDSKPKTEDPTTTPTDSKSGGNGGTTNSVANAAESSSSSGGSGGGGGKASSSVRVGSIVGTGDIVAIRSNEDGSNQFKATFSVTKSNTDNSRSKGALLNFTTTINNSNLTFYGAFTNKTKTNTLICANSSMVNFSYDFFNTSTIMESHRWNRLSLMGGVNYTIGSLASETFSNLSAVGGGFYLFKVGKNVTGNMLLLAVYSPFTKFYEGSWWKSGTLLVPFSSWDYAISKTFKFNVSFSGTWEVNKSMLQYQILTGGKILL